MEWNGVEWSGISDLDREEGSVKDVAPYMCLVGRTRRSLSSFEYQGTLALPLASVADSSNG